MFIEKISINNFRVYKGLNELDLFVDTTQNVSIVSGNNGFGKTSLLTSLVWCLYGKLMADVDERYRKEIYESGGYKRFCQKIMNRIALAQSRTNNSQAYLLFEASAAEEKSVTISKQDKETDLFSVAIKFTKLLIPSIPCDYVLVTRTYHIHNHEETLEILIDGNVNELTREVGHEIFINDFILPKEIAKFFFFDAEKIVSLAEIRSTEEKRILSQAYAEVLGIKKYLDLKDNLLNLRLRLRKKTGKSIDVGKLEKLKKQQEQNEKLISHCDAMIDEKVNTLSSKRLSSDKLQERLIREGTAITLEEFKDFKQLRENLNEEGVRLKTRLKDMMELAPFAIAANKLNVAIDQMSSEQEQENKKMSAALLNRKLTAVTKAITIKYKSALAFSEKKQEQLLGILRETLLPEGKSNYKELLGFSAEQQARFMGIYENLQNAYGKNFRQLISDLKMQQSSYNMVSRKLQDSESKEADPVIKAIRNDKTHVDNQIRDLENELVELKAKKSTLEKENKNVKSQVSELTKLVSVGDIDAEKDATASRLISELDNFIQKLKTKKKASLEKNILQELNRLMHKSNFVHRVEVIIEGELIDIELYDSTGQTINKDSLSKGEQQLYATALLKALVDESNIRFPVFIDSPLQKFDQEHARNIIVDFYPNVSGQVVLFPLLEKELNEAEFKWLLPRVGNVYLIDHINQYHSQFKTVAPQKLFDTYRKNNEHVHQH